MLCAMYQEEVYIWGHVWDNQMEIVEVPSAPATHSRGPRSVQRTCTWIFTFVSPFAMDDNVRDTKMTTRKRERSEIFYTCSSTLSIISIVLVFALFARIETVARDLRTMDTKFSLQIQQIRDVLKESSASSRGSENFDTSNGKVTENLLWIFLVFRPNFVTVYIFSFIKAI